jgi:hypothetical protein
METMDPLAKAVGRLSDDGMSVEVAGRTIRLLDPVRGDAGSAALRVLGLVQAASPVATAAHGPTQVAAAVWMSPALYVVRWSRNRWVVGYRLARGSWPNDYVRSEGRIPGHLETGHWYETVPEEVQEVFVEVGLSLEFPPFPVPAQPEPVAPPPKPAPSRAPAARSTAPRRPAAPRKAAAPKVPVRKPPPPLADRLCPGCNMRRTPNQFDTTSAFCVDRRA